MGGGVWGLICLGLLGTYFFSGNDVSVPASEITAPLAYVDHPESGTNVSMGEAELMVMDLATSQRWQLTDDSVYDISPIWSPSGSHLLFLSTREHEFATPGWTGSGTQRVYTYNLQNGDIQLLDLSWARRHERVGADSPLGWIDCATWSPTDTTKVYLGVTVGGLSPSDPSSSVDRRLLVVHTGERKVEEVTAIETCGHMSVSPTGRYIKGVVNPSSDETVFQSVYDTQTQSWVSKPSELAGDDGFVHQAMQWLPDGRLLTSSFPNQNQDNEVRVYAVDVASSKSELISTFRSKDHEFLRRLVPYPVTEGMPLPSLDTILSSPTFIVEKRVGMSMENDLFAYTPSKQHYVRLTHTKNPKLSVNPVLK